MCMVMIWLRPPCMSRQRHSEAAYIEPPLLKLRQRCRELVLDAYPGSATETAVQLPHQLGFSALTSLTRLELCGYTDDGDVLRRDCPDTIGDNRTP